MYADFWVSSYLGFPALRNMKFEVDRWFQYQNEIYFIVGAQIMAHWKRREILIQLWYLELHDSPLELKGELQYLDENCHIRGEKMTILV